MSYRKRRRRHSQRRHSESEFLRSPNPNQLRRSTSNKIWLGVCGGLAERYGWDAALVRLAFVVSMFGMGPFPLIAYIVLAIITPKGLAPRRATSPEEDEFWRGVSDRPRATFGEMKYTFMDLEDRLQRMERKVTSDEWRLRKEFRDLERH